MVTIWYRISVDHAAKFCWLPQAVCDDVVPSDSDRIRHACRQARTDADFDASQS
jgi:hypothetical protein